MGKKIYIASLTAVILCIIVLVAIFPNQSPAKTVVAGVAAGDTFTYGIKGFANKIDANATIPESCSQLNMTDWYKVTITNVTDDEVYFSAVWRFINGTENVKTGKVDIETGINNSVDFWAIYASGLKATDRARPLGLEGVTINETKTRLYKGVERETNSITLERVLYDYDDPSLTRSLNDYLSIHFDRQTGMLVELTNTQLYSSPAIFLRLEWRIIDSSVWDVS